MGPMRVSSLMKPDPIRSREGEARHGRKAQNQKWACLLQKFPYSPSSPQECTRKRYLSMDETGRSSTKPLFSGQPRSSSTGFCGLAWKPKFVSLTKYVHGSNTWCMNWLLLIHNTKQKPFPSRFSSTDPSFSVPSLPSFTVLAIRVFSSFSPSFFLSLPLRSVCLFLFS